MDTSPVDRRPRRTGPSLPALVRTLLAAAVLVAAGYFLARYFDRKEEQQVASTSIDKLVVALREPRNRLQVYRLSGTVTTHRSATGGFGDLLQGEMTAKQPWSVAYYVNMGDLTLEDYAWDEGSRTLLVRAPSVAADAPNIDESRQVVGYKGPLITRDMQTQLRTAVARGAKQQAANEASKPENMAAAQRAARDAIARNLQAPLRAAGLGNVNIVVRAPTEGSGSNAEQWDVSRSIAEVLQERAGR